MERRVQRFLCTKRKNNFHFSRDILFLQATNQNMKKLLFIFLFASTITYAQQVRNDSIRRMDSIAKVLLQKQVDSLQKKIDSIKKIEDSEKKLNVKEWSGGGRFTFLLNQSAYSKWISGGENAIAANLVVNYDFNWKRGFWKWDNKIITSYGSSYLEDQGYRKTDDRFEYNSVLAYNKGKSWYYSFFSNFISQYTRGYDYSSDPRRLVSTTLSPAYWSFGPGMFWRKNENYRVNISPATSRFTFVSREFSGNYGVEEGKTSAYGLGFNLSGFIKYNIIDNLSMENIIQIYSDYLEKPQNIDINYQTNFYYTFNKFLSFNLTLHLIIDDNAVNTFQFRQLFGLGFNYLFHKI